MVLCESETQRVVLHIVWLDTKRQNGQFSGKLLSYEIIEWFKKSNYKLLQITGCAEKVQHLVVKVFIALSVKKYPSYL